MTLVRSWKRDPEDWVGGADGSPPVIPGVTWLPIDGAWFPDTPENGTLTVLTPLAFADNRITGSCSLAALRDGLTEGSTRRGDPSLMLGALGTTTARILAGVDLLLTCFQPQGDQGDGALLAVGLTNDVSKASLDGIAGGYRGGAVAGTWRSRLVNAASGGPNLGSTDAGSVISRLTFSGSFCAGVSQGYATGDVSLANFSSLDGTTLSGGSSLRSVVFMGCGGTAGGSSTHDAYGWVGLLRDVEGTLPVPAV